MSGKVAVDAKAGRTQALPSGLEDEIVQKTLHAAGAGFGISRRQMLTKTAHVVKQLKLETPFKDDIPGKTWWAGLKRRHPEISIRKPEALSTVRSRMLNPVVTANYFETLFQTMSELKIHTQPQSIWNMDESGFQLSHKPVAVVARKGARVVYSRTAPNRDNITVLVCANADGGTIPPMFVVKGTTKKSLEAYDVASGYQGAKYSWQKKGWMEEELGVEWFRTVFLPNCGIQRPQLLLLDSHCSHEVVSMLELAKAERIHILALPPHTTHALQPLDRSIFGPLSTQYNRVCSAYMAASPQNVVNKWVWPRLFSEAYKASVTPENIKRGFSACGIHPFDASVVPQSMMAPSAATNIPIPATPSVVKQPVITPTEEPMPSTSAEPEGVVVGLTVSATNVVPEGARVVTIPSLVNWDVVSSIFDVEVPKAHQAKTPSRAIKSHRMLTSDDVITAKKTKLKEKEAKEKLIQKKKDAKQRKKGQKKVANKASLCSVCLSEDSEGDGEVQWVACSACGSWMHYKCIQNIYPVPYEILKLRIVYCSVCHD